MSKHHLKTQTKITMCNCIKELQEKTKEAVQKQYPDLSVDYLLITATMEENPKAAVTAFYYAEKTLKNGNKKEVFKTINLIATHCPFCGETYDIIALTEKTATAPEKEQK